MVSWLAPYMKALTSLVPGTITSTYRSWTDQYNLWRNRAHNPYPVAPPGESWHQYGRAFDFIAQDERYQSWLGQTWRSWGGSWSPEDPIHFQA